MIKRQKKGKKEGKTFMEKRFLQLSPKKKIYIYTFPLNSLAASLSISHSIYISDPFFISLLKKKNQD